MFHGFSLVSAANTCYNVIRYQIVAVCHNIKKEFHMKKRIVSLLCAAALTVGLAGCTISSTPDTVGTIGETEISAGMYLLSQYQGYYAALDAANAQEVAEDATLPNYNAMAPKEFLGQTITVDDAEVLVSDYVAEHTLKNLQYYAAVDSSFNQLGGELSEESLNTANADAKSIWEANEDLYKKNGFSLATVQEYQYTLHKADALLDMVYGPNGTQPVSEEDLKKHMQEDMLFVHYAMVPLYNAQTFEITDENTAKITEQCQAILDEFNQNKDGADVYKLFEETMKAKLPAVYETAGNTFQEENLIAADLLSNSLLDTYYPPESANALRALNVGDTVMLSDSGFAVEMFLRADPIATGEWDGLRTTVLYEVYGQMLQDGLLEQGAAMESNLDADAMSKLPAAKIVMKQA